jgi:5-methylcytosine-specific restriction endonuclease McrA
MPRPKIPCPQCGQPKSAQAELCRRCKPTYERTDQHRARLSAALKGKPHSYRSASTRPEVAARIAEWWTPERREAKRLELLARNPEARYHGLSAREAKRRKAGRVCQHCGNDGSDSRLDIHHRDRDKRNQEPSNLMVLCHRCHMQEHARAQESGWDRYHAKRRSQAQPQ